MALWEQAGAPRLLARVHLMNPRPANGSGAYSLQSELCERVILSLILFLVVFAPLAYGAVEPWARIVILCSIALIFGVWLLGTILSKGFRFSFPPFFLPTVLFLALTALQILPLPAVLTALLSPARQPPIAAPVASSDWVSVTVDPDKTKGGALFVTACLGFCFVLMNTFPHRNWVKITLLVVLTVGSLEALYGLVEYWTGRQHIFWYQKVYYLEEVTGTYINHNHFAGLIGPILVLAIGAFVVRFTRFAGGRTYAFEEDGRSFWKKVTATALLMGHLPASVTLLLGSIALMTVALVLSQSRGGLISCAIAVGLQAVLLWRLQSRPAAVSQAAGVLVVLTAVVGAILLPGLLSRFSYTQRDAPQRFELW